MYDMSFFIPLKKMPTVTAQMKRVVVHAGKPHFYEDAPLKAARELFCANLSQNRPEHPMKGPLQLNTIWLYNTKDHRKNGAWKITKPDTDNMIKLFKDCCTKTGFWNDDAQVCAETTYKKWTIGCSGIYVRINTPSEEL